ncbi:MAG: NAD(P)H-dependent glycerol-3-phosphate dehydrogenase [Clostridiales bacterium]|nr:NAD(P)H-dependent glycerol-3-phosphate dehydrogenase [Clostridiales bacterium]
MKKITVIGSGSWGTALACTLSKNGHNVMLWSFLEREAENLKRDGENKEFLPGVKIPDNIKITTDINCTKGAEIVVFAVPSKFVRDNAKIFAPNIDEGTIVVNVAKGLEESSLKRLSEVIKEEIHQCRAAVLSGPSHAEEVGREIPTACVAVSEDIETAKIVQDAFINNKFRIYVNTDMIGVEIGAALKNLIALAAGVCDGIGFGDNTKAAIMTRGLAEITRLGVKMGADRETFYGLTGVGDLIVTCTSMHSRNRRAGILIGQGKSLKETLEEVHMVVEGVNTAEAAYKLSKKYNVEMPITTEIHRVLFEGKDPKQAVIDLMSRDKTHESDSRRPSSS